MKKALSVLKMFDDIFEPKITDDQPLIFDTEANVLGGRQDLWLKDGFGEIGDNPGVYLTQDIKYEKSGNTVDIWYWSEEYSIYNTSWGLGDHRLTASKDDESELHINAELNNENAEHGFTAYALCSPPLKTQSGSKCENFERNVCDYQQGHWLQGSNQQDRQIVDFPGWHYLRHFSSGKISNFNVKSSKGMLCYALLLSSADEQTDAGW